MLQHGGTASELDGNGPARFTHGRSPLATCFPRHGNGLRARRRAERGGKEAHLALLLLELDLDVGELGPQLLVGGLQGGQGVGPGAAAAPPRHGAAPRPPAVLLLRRYIFSAACREGSRRVSAGLGSAAGRRCPLWALRGSARAAHHRPVPIHSQVYGQ